MEISDESALYKELLKTNEDKYGKHNCNTIYKFIVDQCFKETYVMFPNYFIFENKNQ